VPGGIRTVETILHGAPNAVSEFGDRVRIEMNDAKGVSIFGAIDHEWCALKARMIKPYCAGFLTKLCKSARAAVLQRSRNMVRPFESPAGQGAVPDDEVATDRKDCAARELAKRTSRA
jgi:hypothetical protein